MYIELHAASAFSFLEAASSPEALVERAAALGYPALAVLDRDGVYGAPRFHMAAKRAGLKAIVGAELTIKANGEWHRAGGGRTGGGWQSPHPPFLWRLPVLVASREGYRNLCRLLTRMKLAAPKGRPRPVAGPCSSRISTGRRPGSSRSRGGRRSWATATASGGLLDRLVGLFGRTQVYVELQRHLQRDEEADNQALVTLASAFHVPILATNGVRFATPEERPLYDVLTCIRHGRRPSRRPAAGAAMPSAT